MRLPILLLLVATASCSVHTEPQYGYDAVEATSTEAGWQEFAPGGATTCSDGTPYKFWVRPGSPKKLMVYFEGGGGCWFRQNCDPEMQPSYTINLNGQHPSRRSGVFDFSNPANPFDDYTVVFAPYCTGDVHLGANDAVYPPVNAQQSPLTIHHQGLANSDAVLTWTYANLTSPETVFVTGSSAGSIPSPYYAWRIAQRYKDARIVQLGDGSGGYRQLNRNMRPHEPWNTVDAISAAAPFADLTNESFNFEQLYIRAGRDNPNIQFAAYDAAEDDVQKRFLALGGAATESLKPHIDANQADIRAAVPGFRSFIAGGDTHTILAWDGFYTFRVGDMAVRDWVANLANGMPVDDVACTECRFEELAGADMPDAMKPLWAEWQSPRQAVKPFRIFDNVAYVGIDWVAAYVIETSEGLILIDALYGKWIGQLENNLRRLGLNPADVKYVLVTHGHFDHAGGAAYFQRRYGAKVVMSQPDWELVRQPAELPYFAFAAPRQDIVGRDGDTITLGDTTVQLLRTPGHTEGVLSYVYPVRDGERSHQAITLGGVGLNFSGVARTETYIASYEGLLADADQIEVSLPNHAAMGRVFERASALSNSADHPFVDPDGYRADLETFLANARDKLTAEREGRAASPLEALKAAVD